MTVESPRARSRFHSTESTLLLCFGKYIAGAAHRYHAAWLLRVVLNGGADAGDVHVDRPVEGVEPFVPEQIHQGVARHHPAGVLRQREEQRELVARQGAHYAVEPRLPGGSV